jgi:hypothetical protein
MSETAFDRWSEERKLRVYVNGREVTDLEAVTTWSGDAVRLYRDGKSDRESWVRIDGTFPQVMLPGKHVLRFWYPPDGPEVTREYEWANNIYTGEWLFRYVPPERAMAASASAA